MTNNPSEKSPRLPSVIRYIIYAFLTVILSAGCCALLLYLSFNSEYIRSGFVASQAQARVEPIYRQILEMIPNGAALVSEETPQSGTYSFSLSDNAPRHAYVRAQQSYNTTSAFSDVLTIYEAQFIEWGWVAVPLSSNATLISVAFRHPDDENLIAGLCSPVETSLQSDVTQYSVFLDFDETPGCEGRGDRLGCISARYCEYP